MNTIDLKKIKKYLLYVIEFKYDINSIPEEMRVSLNFEFDKKDNINEYFYIIKNNHFHKVRFNLKHKEFYYPIHIFDILGIEDIKKIEMFYDLY